MTPGAGLAVLREPDLGAADRIGLLPAAAAAGAQVRSVLAAADDLPTLDRPRAMVVVGQGAETDAAFLTALAGRSAPAPILVRPPCRPGLARSTSSSFWPCARTTKAPPRRPQSPAVAGRRHWSGAQITAQLPTPPGHHRRSGGGHAGSSRRVSPVGPADRGRGSGGAGCAGGSIPYRGPARCDRPGLPSRGRDLS